MVPDTYKVDNITMLCYDTCTITKQCYIIKSQRGVSFMEYISKKELLEQTGISYGQLYRWKRERLIPDVWFVKQSSYTGQETFLPKEQVLSRIQFILDMKDIHSLDEIREMLSINAEARELTYEQLLDMEDISHDVAVCFKKDLYALKDVVYLVILSRILREYSLTQEQLMALFEGTKEVLEEVGETGYQFQLLHIGYGYYGFLTNERYEVHFDQRIQLLNCFSFDEIAAELREKYVSVCYIEQSDR